MKTKLFTERDYPVNDSGHCGVPLDERINDFIKYYAKNVIDIKFSTSVACAESNYTRSREFCEEALLIYEPIEPLTINYMYIKLPFASTHTEIKKHFDERVKEAESSYHIMSHELRHEFDSYPYGIIVFREKWLPSD